MANKLFYGDNLDVLRRDIPDESVDLIYLDPPFNSNAGYNVLFKAANGASADASIEAFDDTWKWGPTSQDALLDIDRGTNRQLQVMMRAMHDALGDTPLMAYLAMMAIRLVELHRVLKPTGSLYLHCDPTASHYLKLVLDAVFGSGNFLAEIIWKRTSAREAQRRWPRLHDTILCYARVRKEVVFRGPKAATDEDWLRREYRHEDQRGRYTLSDLTAAETRNGPSGKPWRDIDPARIGAGRHWRAVPEQLDRWDQDGLIYWPARGRYPKLKRYLDDTDGTSIGDLWTDIPVLGRTAAERLGYPTQKPRALLERIIAASSEPDAVVLDPFCGCGTAVDAAQKLGRRWIGIDVTHIAIGMIENRIREGYPGVAFETIGVPRNLASAERLAADDPHQFQQWVSWQVGGYPRESKGGDKGVDGWFNYLADASRIETGVLSVKAGDIVNPTMVRDLGRVMTRDRYRFGLFVMKSLPTRGMREEAASHPLIETSFGRYPALQIVTLAELMHGHRPSLPPLVSPVRKAARVETRASHQRGSQGRLL